MILLFGGHGQLGQELTQQASRAGVPLVPFVHRQADITDAAAVMRAIEKTKPSLVANVAAYSKVDQAEDEPEQAFASNAVGPAIIARACARADLPLVHVSTDYVFDGSKDSPYFEDDPAMPLGVYGRSKWEGEQAVRGVGAEYVILRTAWLYGAYGHNFLKTILRLAAERDELRVVGDQKGSPTSTADLAQAILHIWHSLGAAQWGTYHFVGSGSTTWHGFASRVVAAQAPFTGKRPTVTAIGTAEFPTTAKRPRNSVLDCSRFARAFGFRAGPWEQAVDRTVAELLGGNRRG